jgi:2-(1,2-epoxy-1,2-dihydrophenyl)acetyl-CoA isomerase
VQEAGARGRMAAVSTSEPGGSPEADAEPAVVYRRQADVAFITLNRPRQLNAVNTHLVEGLCQSLDRAAADEVAAVVLSGAGRAFCAGHDFKEDLGDESDETARERLDRLQDVTRKVQQLAAPVIAAVHGYALGAGCEFALCCDLVVAHTSAVFGFPEVEVGLSVTGGISHLLPLVVGPTKAKELLLLGTRFDAVEALRLGLVNVVSDDALAQASAWATEVAGRGHLAVSLAKTSLDRGPHEGIDAAYETEIVNSLALRATSEATAAATAFRQRNEGREPPA